ncbi:MAG: hypothetical protein EA412_04990 [Chitinophagaceae bacterium]|nr:MAG: hypothetical protein EA412_04990 [Chitinophagaceae bacterium]
MKRINTILLIILATGLFYEAAAQSGISINISGDPADNSAMLDINSDSKGFLPPRMTTQERDQISNPSPGLLIYNTTTNCINVFNSPAWHEMCGECTPYPPTADAGSDQILMDTTATTLAANGQGSPAYGIWTIISSTGGSYSFSDENDPEAIFTGTEGNTYLLEWELSTACDTTSDQVEISFLLGSVEIPGNAFCQGAPISATPCSSVPGAVLNDDPSTPLGIEYDWAVATDTTHGVGFGATTGTRALVEIGGQCWARYNANIIPPDPAFANPNPGVSGDVGWHGYWDYSATENFPNEGRLYQWSAAMNGSTDERAQGVCPDGWHIPSDCEWMYLENTLGMSTADQQVANAWRYSGDVGFKLSDDTPLGTNSSGFTALMTGFRQTTQCYAWSPCNMSNNQNITHFWTSNENPANLARASRRNLHNGNTLQNAVHRRVSETKAHGFSVRCLKD